MVGHRPLEASILVRIQVWQPTWKMSVFRARHERCYGFNAEDFVPQEKVRTDGLKNQSPRFHLRPKTELAIVSVFFRRRVQGE